MMRCGDREELLDVRLRRAPLPEPWAARGGCGRVREAPYSGSGSTVVHHSSWWVTCGLYGELQPK